MNVPEFAAAAGFIAGAVGFLVVDIRAGNRRHRRNMERLDAASRDPHTWDGGPW